jgi:AraC-like DNA-binding protein
MDYLSNMHTPSPPFQVRTAGFINRQPYHSTPGTRQGDIMLTVFLDDFGVYRNSHGTIHVHGAMVGLVTPVDPGVLMADAQSPYVHYYCRFRGSYAVWLTRQILAARSARFFAVANAEAVADCVRRMGHHSSPTLPDTMGPREGLLAQALVELTAAPVESGKPVLLPATVEEYLRNHIAEPTSLSRMADHFMVSRTTLCRTVARVCGDSVQRIHERMKLEWAQTLLATGRYNVSEVAHRVGYRDPLYFSRVFGRALGVAPKPWSLGSRSSSR